MRHSQCVHISVNTEQPLCSIRDDSGKESFTCMACASETIAGMLSTHSPDQIGNAVRFDRCGHGLNPAGDFCSTCYHGITSYLLVMGCFAAFSDKPLSNRLRKVVKVIGLANGFGKSSEPPHNTKGEE